MARYLVDPGLSRLTVKVSAGGLLSAFGHNPTISLRDFEGEARFTPETPDGAAVRFRTRPAKLEVLDDLKTSDRRDIERETRETVLETAKYPEIVFEGSNISAKKTGEGFYRAEVTGNLTLHGVTQLQTVPAHVSVIGDTIRVSGEVPLRQSDYGIRLASAVGGALKVKDEVKIAFEFVARRENGA
jgi:polyisoprenoid-binding protein YceI